MSGKALATTIALFVVLDAIVVAHVFVPVYRSAFPSQLRRRVDVPAAVAFYTLFLLGLQWFVLRHDEHRLFNAALYGTVTYGTYAYTARAIFEGMTWPMAAMDTAWGGIATTVAVWLGTSLDV